MNNDPLNTHCNGARLISSAQPVLAQIHSVGSTAAGPHASSLVGFSRSAFVLNSFIIYQYIYQLISCILRHYISSVCYYKTWFSIEIKVKK